jgi:LL-H family phage holin
MNTVVLDVVVAILTFCVGWTTKEVCEYVKSKGLLAKIQHNKAVVDVIVLAVEQIYKSFKGNEKLEKAKVEVVNLLNEKKIKISTKELDMLIEASVKEMNRVSKNILKK